MELHYRTFDLPFKHPFTISKGTKTHQSTLIVMLRMGPFVGFGEAPAISYYNITVEQMVEELEQKRKLVEKFALTDPERYWHYLHHLFPANPFLVCALDMAGWDIWGKMKKMPLYQLWKTDFENVPQTDFTIGIDTIENMVKKIEETPWPIYKIKLGTANDIEIISELRKHTSSVFRVDANEGWTLEEALEKINTLKELGVELVEQPLPKNNWEGMKVLFKKSPLPLFADESCVSEHDVEKCAGYFRGINIKLTKCSGITPARRMISKARELGLQVMMGCMNESTIGSAAIAHFMPQVDKADADGPLLLARDLATGLNFNNGHVDPPAGFGLGIKVHF